MTTLLALEALAAVIRTIESPFVKSDCVFVYPPAEFGATPVVIAEYPTVIVSHAILGVEDTWRIKAQGIGLHKWTAQVQVFVAHKTTPEFQVEQLVRGWYRAMADVLLANRSLSDAVYYLGDASTNDTGLMTMTTGYLSWYNQHSQTPEPYWGIMFTIPVTQIFNQDMG